MSGPEKVEVAVEEEVRLPPRAKLPVTVKALFTDEEESETKPPERVEREETERVEEASRAPVTAKRPENLEVAVVEVARILGASR